MNCNEKYIIDGIPRYSKIKNKCKREIVLLKSFPCKYRKCTFCDYILDNSTDKNKNIEINKKALSFVTGEFNCLEVIDSASFFDLPLETINLILKIIKSKNIKHLFIESHYIYKNSVDEFREYLNKNGVCLTVKIGIESFDDDFRNKFLNKGIYFENVEKLKRSFDSPCLMVGIKGQTKQMISKDIEILTNNFDYGTINIYTNNSTNIKRDDSLVSWFYENYSYLKDDPRYDFLDVNTDFGVGN